MRSEGQTNAKGLWIFCTKSRGNCQAKEQKPECLKISNDRPNKAHEVCCKKRVKMQRGLLIFLCKCFVQSCCRHL